MGVTALLLFIGHSLCQVTNRHTLPPNHPIRGYSITIANQGDTTLQARTKQAADYDALLRKHGISTKEDNATSYFNLPKAAREEISAAHAALCYNLKKGH